MEIRIKETGEIEELTIIDPANGLCWAIDLTGDDDNITFDGDYHTCDQETFDWWVDLIERYQAADNRLHEIRTYLSNDDRERLYEFLEQIVRCDLENYPESLEDILDRWEKLQEGKKAVEIIRSVTTYQDAYGKMMDNDIENPDLHWNRHIDQCGEDAE